MNKGKCDIEMNTEKREVRNEQEQQSCTRSIRNEHGKYVGIEILKMNEEK